MIEMLVSLLCLAFITLALYDTFSAFMRVSRGASHQVAVSSIAEEVLDAARNQGYTTLLSYAGQTKPLLINKLSAADTGPPLIPRPVLQDRVGMSFSSSSTATTLQNSNATGTETVTDLGNGLVQVTVTVNWSNYTGPHTYTTSAVVSQYGIHL